MNDDPKYHLRVAREARLVESNVLWFAWCGYVYAEAYGTYDLTILLRNLAVAGALCAAYWTGREEGVADCDHMNGLIGAWHPGCGREVPR